jgi:metallo-beta-lactamase class B
MAGTSTGRSGGKPCSLKRLALWLLLLTAWVPRAHAQRADTAATPNCSSCAEWNEPQAPFRIFGNTYYVGTRGLASLLVTTSDGHLLVDGGLPESAPLIARNIAALGFRMADVRLIVNSHVHFDHAGGIAALQRMSGAEVLASAASVGALRTGEVGRDDPQFGAIPGIAPVRGVREIPAGDTVRLGDVVFTVIRTAGHTPGGTSWTWRACEGARCWTMVYGDSQSAVSADDFRFTATPHYPRVLDDFAAGLAALERAPCDVLITPHPGASALWERLARREGGERDALRDPQGCARYAQGARERLRERVARERAGR